MNKKKNGTEAQNNIDKEIDYAIAALIDSAIEGAKTARYPITAVNNLKSIIKQGYDQINNDT